MMTMLKQLLPKTFPIAISNAFMRTPQVFAALADSWTDLSIRYLVPARERRRWKSELTVRVSEMLGRPENASRVFPAYPRRQVQAITPDGRAVPWTHSAAGAAS